MNKRIHVFLNVIGGGLFFSFVIQTTANWNWPHKFNPVFINNAWGQSMAIYKEIQRNYMEKYVGKILIIFFCKKSISF